MTAPPTLDGRVAVVTGARGGIGSAIIEYLTRCGSQTVSIDRLPPDESRAPSTIAIQADLADQASLVRALTEVERTVRAVDVLVNAHGDFRADSELSGSLEDITKLFRNNTVSLIAWTEGLLPLLQKGTWPLVVNVASTDGIVASAGQSCEIGVRHDIVYAATKGAVVTLTKAWAMSWASHRIRVNAICPTVVRSPMTNSLLAIPGKEAELAAELPAGRIGEPDDVATAVEVLYRLTFTTGHVLPVDGGYLCQ